MSLAETALFLDLQPERYAWRAWGACRQRPDLDFFPGRGESTRQQKAVCATCPVQGICLDVAIANGEHYGIWGGTSERERKRMRKGTPSGRLIDPVILNHLATHGPFTGPFRSLEQRLGLTRCTGAAAVRRLEANGLVTVETLKGGNSPLHVITPTTPGDTP